MMSYDPNLDGSPNTDADPSGQGPLRVMFIITSMHVGGAEMLLSDLIRRLDKTRVVAELCCLKERGTLGDTLAEQIPVHANLLAKKYDLRLLSRLTRLLCQRQIDAVITVGAGNKMFWGRLAARRAGVPVIICALHSTGWPHQITWLNRRLTNITDAFIAAAQPHARHLVHSERLPAPRVWVIPNGVDTDRYRPSRPDSKIRAELGISSGAPLAGIVAVLRPEKNHEFFLQVARRVRHEVPDAHFLVVGDGPRRGDLESLARQLELSKCVHFLGQRTDVPDVLNLLDVFVLTSRMEANPVSILEALASGTPVVATRVGSIGETVLDGRNGYLVEPGDASSMATRLAELLQDPARARQFGSAGRRHVVQNWSLERMVSGYQELIERLHRLKTAPAAEQENDQEADAETAADHVTPTRAAAV
jgi:glycosyltransferase involved in cell wall biosynthesis